MSKHYTYWELHYPGGATFRTRSDNPEPFTYDGYHLLLHVARTTPEDTIVRVDLPDFSGAIVTFDFRWFTATLAELHALIADRP